VPGNEVNFRLGLPTTGWNGKFYFSGVGGLGGRIGSLDKGLARGYASASTDTGHSADDPTWGSNRAKEIDYGHRGTHVTAVASKALAAGVLCAARCSTPTSRAARTAGARRSWKCSAIRKISTASSAASATGTPMQAGRAIVYQHMLASPDNFLTAEKIELLSKATLAACDDKDGLKDGLITNPPACSFDVASLTCKAGDAPDCLTPGQVTTVKKVYGGVKMKDGTTFAYGFPVGHEGGPTGWRAWISGANPPVKQEDGSLGLRHGASAERLRADGAELPLPRARQRRSEIQLEGARHRSRLAAAQDDDRDPEPARSRSASVPEARRQVDHVSRLVRSRHQRRGHGGVLRSDDEDGWRAEGRR
jgi:feruloyl esterase